PEVTPPAVAVGGARHGRIIGAGPAGGARRDDAGGGAGGEPLLPACRARRATHHLALAIRRDAGCLHGVSDTADELPVVLRVRTAGVDGRLHRAPRRLAVRRSGTAPGGGHRDPGTNEEDSDEYLAHGRPPSP